MRGQVVLAVLLVALLGVSLPVAASQEHERLVSPLAAAVATDLINGTVLATQSVDTGSEVHSLALVRVDKAVEGDLSGDVFVEVPGGTSADGLDVVVSHQPTFQVSDVVQLALLRATGAEEAALTGGIAPVYSVVGGIDGAVAVSGSLVSQASAAGDFTLTGSKWDREDSTRWPIPYRINTANSGLSAADTVAALQGGIQPWVDDTATDIEFDYQGTTSASPSNYNDGSNTVGWVSTGAADQFLAQAIWVSSSGTTLAFDIRFNTDYRWAHGAQSGRFDIETVQLHETGHVLGLGHTTASLAEVMYPSIASNTTKGLGAGDLSGVAGMYPAASPPPPPVPTVERFADVRVDAYYADPVVWAFSEGITTGTSSTTFSPERAANRGELALLLHRFAGGPEPTSMVTPFRDVPASGDLATAIAWLYERGITTGTSATSFSPERGLVRGQMAAFLWRFAGRPNTTIGHDFEDVPSGVYFDVAAAWMLEDGLTTGTSSTTFSPNARLTRGQVVTFLYRLAGEPPVG